MRHIALDWTLSRRLREDLGVPPQTWEQYSREGRICDLYIVNSRKGEKKSRSRKKAEFLRCMLCNGMDVGFRVRQDEQEKPS